MSWQRVGGLSRTGKCAGRRAGELVADIAEQEWAARLVDRIFGCVEFRKAYHLCAGGLLVVGTIVLDTVWFAALCVCWLILFGIVSKRISTAVLGLLVIAVVTGVKVTTFGAALVFVVGDGVAALAGTAYGKTKLPWHDQKTVVGSLAFLGAATLAMLAALPILVDCSPREVAMLAVLPSLAGCLAEALPFALVRDIRDGLPDDNLVVLLSSGAVMHWLTRVLQVG